VIDDPDEVRLKLPGFGRLPDPAKQKLFDVLSQYANEVLAERVDSSLAGELTMPENRKSRHATLRMPQLSLGGRPTGGGAAGHETAMSPRLRRHLLAACLATT
jgi:hypothetical protein